MEKTIKTATMELVYEEAGIYYCNVNFSVNGIEADFEDFGDKDSGGSDGNYGCLDMHFVPDKPSDEILRKYDITETDYQIVVDMLCEELAFGCCGMCW